MESRKVRLWAVALAMAVAVPAFAGDRARSDAASATLKIEKARTAIEAARAPRAGETSSKPSGRERLILRAQFHLEKATRQRDDGNFAAAERSALKAEHTAWQARAPRKGDR